VSWGVSPWVYPVWDSLGFLDLGNYSLPHFGEVFNYYLLKYFLMVFLFVFFFWDSYDSNVGAFNIVLEVSEIVLISFNLFFFFPLWFIYFYHLSSTSLILSSASIILLFVASSVFFISFIALFIIYSLFFISSRSLLNLSCIFSILVSRLFICHSILISRFWIIFTIIIQSSLSGRFPVSSSFVWWAFILFLYLLGIPLSLHLVYISEFGVAFLYSDSLWSSLYYLKKLEIELPYNTAIPLLGIHTEETIIERDTCTPMFISALFIIARSWKQSRCPSADEWIRKLWYIYTMEYYSAIKKNTFESVLMSWMKLEPIIQSEVNQKEKHQYSILTHIYGI